MSADDSRNTDRDAARRAGTSTELRPEKGKPPLVSCAYGQMVHLELFPDAVIKQACKLRNGRPPRSGGVRGKIETLSKHSAGRLREFLLTWWVPDRQLVMAWTFTIRRPVTPAEWRQLWHCWRNRANVAEVAAVYRVELQKRKVPHVHMTAWHRPINTPEGQAEQLTFHPGWLKTITPKKDDGEQVFDWAEYNHAVYGRRVDDQSAWGIYQSLHSGKPGQSGWLGKQWGVIGRKFFKRRDPVQLELTLPQYWRFRRIVCRWLKSRGTRFYGLPANGRWVRAVPSLFASAVVEFVKR